jgi:hypothetical protein
MNDIEDYTLVLGDAGFLSGYVQRRIKEGWQPLGGPVTVTLGGDQRPTIGQAMVKYKSSCGLF